MTAFVHSVHRDVECFVTVKRGRTSFVTKHFFAITHMKESFMSRINYSLEKSIHCTKDNILDQKLFYPPSESVRTKIQKVDAFSLRYTV